MGIDCLASLFCHEGELTQGLCTNILYAQEKQIPGFHGYDWGDPQTNWAHHQSYTAPEYDLADVKTPVALYWSDNDYFAMPGDILDTIVGLPNIVSGMNHRVEYEKFTHLDFLWGIDADKYVYSY